MSRPAQIEFPDAVIPRHGAWRSTEEIFRDEGDPSKLLGYLAEGAMTTALDHSRPGNFGLGVLGSQ